MIDLHPWALLHPCYLGQEKGIQCCNQGRVLFARVHVQINQILWLEGCLLFFLFFAVQINAVSRSNEHEVYRVRYHKQLV
jgi:hypothetical protein